MATYQEEGEGVGLDEPGNITWTEGFTHSNNTESNTSADVRCFTR